MAKRMKTNVTQWTVLIDFLEEHPEMVTHAFVSYTARENYKILWAQIATQLNSLGFGVKTPEKWIEAFTKWKSKVKGKAQDIICGMKKTGGGGSLPPLTAIEERLMSIVGWKGVKGDNTTELGLDNTLFGEPLTTSLPSTSGISKGISCDRAKMLVVPLVKTYVKPDNRTDVSPPSLSFFNKENEVDLNHSESVTLEKENSPNNYIIKKTMKKKLTNEKVSAKKIGCSKKGDPATLLRLHEETMEVLKHINENLSRLADSNENQNIILTTLMEEYLT